MNRLLTFVLVWMGTVAVSQSSQADVSFELGGSLGTPGGLNLNTGFWTPFVLKASGGSIGKIRGAQANLGFAFDHEGSFWQNVTVAGTVIKGDLQWKGIGPFYSFNWSGFFLELGVSFGSGVIEKKKTTGGQFFGQIGYTYIFGRK